MKLSVINSMKDVERDYELAKKLCNTYVASGDVSEMVVDSEVVRGTLGTIGVYEAAIKYFGDNQKRDNITIAVLGTSTILLSGYYVYNEFVKDSKIGKKIKSKFNKK